MDWPVVVMLLIASHVIVLGIGFYIGTKFGRFVSRQEIERQQQVPERHRRNGRNGH